MELLPPRISGPLSECSRTIGFSHAIPGATIVIVRTRNDQTEQVGKGQAIESSGTATIDPLQDLLGGDLVSAFQYDGSGASAWQPDAVQVQTSVAVFNPPQVFGPLYHCSQGVILAAIRPGTRVELLHAGGRIGAGTAVNGSAFVRLDDVLGLPPPGSTLTVRQLICPRPPPPSGASEWMVDTPLPPTEALPAGSVRDGRLPAPIITAGLSGCSRAVRVEQVVPGTVVVIEDEKGGWWATLGPATATSHWIELPTGLVEGGVVEVRQEVSPRCGIESERRKATVGPQVRLERLRIGEIHCHMDPLLWLAHVKPGADLEYEIVDSPNRHYRSVATGHTGPFPAPPMMPDGQMRARQGECGLWGDWSEYRTTPILARPVPKPDIIGTLFQCQNEVTIDFHDLFGGIARVVSKFVGEIAQFTPEILPRGSVAVAPSLILGDEIFVVRELCGVIVESERKTVQPLTEVAVGELRKPFAGDVSVAVEDVTSGAYVEIWDQDRRLGSGFAPPSDSGKVTVSFGVVPPLRAGQYIHARFRHCARFGRNRGDLVVYRPPELDSVSPSAIEVPASQSAVGAHGRNFVPGSTVVLKGIGTANTTFKSDRELVFIIAAQHLAAVGTIEAHVRLPDGQTSGARTIQLQARPEPPAKPTPPASMEGYGSVEIFNCHDERRDLHLYIRDLTAGGGFELVEEVVGHHYGAAGQCPSGSGFSLDLRDGHVVEIVAVDPYANGCVPPGGSLSDAGPLQLACRKGALTLLGKAGAPSKDWIIG